MEGRWIKRRAHSRRLLTGTTVFVRESWVFIFREVAGKKRRYRSPCPRCGAGILTMRMRNGGWAHFEGGEGLSRIKHPCFDRETVTAKREDDRTIDLFADWPEPVEESPPST